MRRLTTVLAAALLVLGGFLARDLLITTGANAAVGGMNAEMLRTDPDFRNAVEWVVERCDIEPGLGGRYEIDC